MEIYASKTKKKQKNQDNLVLYHSQKPRDIIFIGVWLFYDITLVSINTVQQSESSICIHFQ